MKNSTGPGLTKVEEIIHEYLHVEYAPLYKFCPICGNCMDKELRKKLISDIAQAISSAIERGEVWKR